MVKLPFLIFKAESVLLCSQKVLKSRSSCLSVLSGGGMGMYQHTQLNNLLFIVVSVSSLSHNDSGPESGYELAHPNIYHNRKLLQLMKGPILQTQSCNISTTHGSSRITKRSPSEDPAWIVVAGTRGLKPDQYFAMNSCKIYSIVYKIV